MPLLRPIHLLLFLLASSLHAQVTLSEFMANNQRTLRDNFGQYEDWIELANHSPDPVNLANWALTDDPQSPSKWRFPAVLLPAGQSLLVFASNRDLRDPAQPLHTNFRLSDHGEFLALAHPDGTFATQFAPAYPPQAPDVSFGFGQELRSLTNLTQGAIGTLHLPASDSLELSWVQPEFDDSSWTHATNGIGFDTRLREDPASGAPHAVWDLQPTGFWRFNEIAGPTAANDSPLGPTLDLAPFGAVRFGVAGPRPPAFQGFETANYAAAFNAFDARLETPFHPNLNPPRFAVSCWVRLTGGHGQYRSPLTSRVGQAGQQAGYVLYATPSDTWEFWTGSGNSWNILPGGPVAYSQWTHLAGTYDGAVLRLYTNGVLASGRDFLFRANDRYPFRVGGGATEGSGDYFFAGDIDEVAFFDRPLSSQEILRLFQSATNTFSGGAITNTGPSPFAPLVATDLRSSMHNQFPGVYFRLPFVLPDPHQVDRLILRMKYDDGFIAYLNGVEAAKANAPPFPIASSTATNRQHHAQAVVFEEFNLADALPFLRPGTNLLALHGLNDGATNADFLLLAELESTTIVRQSASPGYFTDPTPNQPNHTASSRPGPLILSPTHQPAVPSANQPLHLTATLQPVLAPPNPATVTLHYRVMFGPLISIPMFDDGQHHEGAPNDNVFGAAIPAGIASPGQMIRWFFTATDIDDRPSRWPLFLDPLRSPEFLGTVVSDPSLTSLLPLFHWFAANPAAGRTRTGTRCAVFANGLFRDNVLVRERGGFTAYGSQKFDFNPGDLLPLSDDIGPVEEVNLNSNGSDPSFIRQPLAFESFRLGGSPASDSFPMLLRLNGRPDRVGLYVEQVDERYLRRRGFDPGGALYKFVQRSTLTPVLSDTVNGVEKKTRLGEDRSDLQTLVDGLALTNTPNRQTAFILDHFNVPQIVNHLAQRAIIQDADSVRKNFYLHRDSNHTGEWSLFPWDKDWTFAVTGGAGPHYAHPFLGTQAYLLDPPNRQWSLLLEAWFNLPTTREMYLRRLRTLMDQQLGPPGSPYGPLETRAMAWMQTIGPDVGLTVSNQLAGVLSYFPQRRTDLYVTFAATNLAAGPNALIPTSQPARPNLLFLTPDFNPPSGNQDHEFICLTNPNPFAVDVSAWKLTGDARFTCRPGTVIPSHQALFLSPNVNAFRQRPTPPHGHLGLFVQGNYDGRLSARGGTLVLLDATGTPAAHLEFPAQPTPAQQFLRLTQIMFNPPSRPNDPFDSQQYEFLALRNISSQAALDLTGISFSRGLSFTFTGPQPTVLLPGHTLHLARNPVAFTHRYGPNLPVAGPYQGALDNAGESLRLDDPSGETILEFAYNPQWHPSTDGPGGSLVILDPLAPWDSWGDPNSWQSSLDLPLTLAVTLPSPNSITLSIPSLVGHTYLLETTDHLSPASWEALFAPLPGNGHPLLFADPTPPTRHRFYRIRLLLEAP